MIADPGQRQLRAAIFVLCKAAEELGMHRNTLSRTLAELDLDTAQIRNGLRRPPTSERPRLQAISARLATR